MGLALSNEIKELLDGPNFAHLATLMPDGSPQSVPVWVGREEDYVLICTGEGSLKAKNVRRDPRVALSIVDFHDPYKEAPASWPSGRATPCATSKMKTGRTPQPGGNVDGGWYHIPGGGKDFFKMDTWLLFDEPQELSAQQLLALKFNGQIKIVGNLRPGIANEICNTMRRCNDVSDYHRGLLGPAHQPKPKN
jgi:hypothetical protein